MGRKRNKNSMISRHRRLIVTMGVGGVLALLLALGLFVRSTPTLSPLRAQAAAGPITGSPIGPNAARGLGMAITGPAASPAVTVDVAKGAALAGWPGCTAGSARYVHLLWPGWKAVDADVFLVPLDCSYGMTASQGVGRTGVATAALPPATFKVALVSRSGELMVTVTGASSDPPPQ